MSESRRVREAMRKDREEMAALWRRIVWSSDDLAAARIAEFEAATGMRATEEDWQAARLSAVPQPEEPRP